MHFYFGMWAALEDVDEGNGPLLVWPGGHRIGHVDPDRIASEHHPPGEPVAPICDRLWNEYQAEVERRCMAAGITGEPVLAGKGDTVIWHPLLPHAGAPLGDHHRTRFSIVFHTTPEHVPMYQGNVFFDASAKPSADPKWGYREVDDRLVADHGEAEFPAGSKSSY